MKAMKHITALKARRNLGQLLEEVYYRGSRYVIERAGRPMAAVVPLSQCAGQPHRPKPQGRRGGHGGRAPGKYT
jgi:prevent-host-death family protein